MPIQAVGVAGLLSEYMLMLLRPAPPYTSNALAVNGILLVVAGLLWWRQTRRQARLGGPEARPPRLVFRLVRGVAGLALTAAVVTGTLVVGLAVTRLPGSFDMSHSEQMDFGGGPESGPAHHGTVSVADLTGGADVTGKPDKSFTLTAVKTRLTVGAGRTVDTWAYNGQVPGPTLTMNEGDLVEVTLINQIPDAALTVHWHGLDVPNSQDGVPGVTQDAVRTGQRHVYRFRVHQVGTFWYHSHQSAYGQVDRGLYGALVALPRGASPDPYDMAVTVHDWKVLKKDPLSRTESAVTFDRAGGLTRRAVPAGRQVRLRVVVTSSAALSDEVTPTFVLTGTPFRVAATDGTEINQPGELPAGTRIPVGTGGRADLTFTMPDGPVRLTDLEDPNAGLVLSPDGTASAPAPPADGPLFERWTYGAPAPTPFGAKSTFDRQFTLVLDDRPGFYDGQFVGLRTINGKVFPDTPMLMVREGDLAKITVASRGHASHPMHLHGHQVLVLSKNGTPVTGSPWWTDTLEVRPGDSYEMAFRANNPGIWMDHCHNLHHAATGMVMHLGYEGVTSPYRAGRGTGNTPEGDDDH
ncbi:multicopper oxidase family protein [Micromonospora yasonensis]|uniref:multicopper oxidase family protein n=1 Tax=Micromonospora yasonensis TaxID=1128667 RepID=UPI0029F544F6|nr:multicopper oxidase family protein [Micromonospora yasonensis]